jgi:hypothetical protein
MAVTGIYLLHKSWCKRQKNDHMIATLDYKLLYNSPIYRGARRGAGKSVIVYSGS